jgi:SAM-dependent methyltransferase
MKKNYDTQIAEHYRGVAETEGLSPTSTMADEITRGKETDAILTFVAAARKKSALDDGRPLSIMDIGCGNGYTLEVLANNYPGAILVGVEKSDKLRELALSRFQGNDRVFILEGDIRDENFARDFTADILVCQRVLINLLDIEDQKLALNNIINAVKSGETARGSLLFIECFANALANLNEARSEFDLAPMNEAHHNLYLPDDFFNTAALIPFDPSAGIPPANFLSTHYYVTRVLHPFFIANKPFKRNSEFVRFFTHALKENIGDYSPLKFCAFEKAHD